MTGVDAAFQHKIRGLIDGYQPHHSLCAEFYTSEDIYRAEVEHIFCRSWMYAGHISQLPKPGCYLLVDFDRESLIVVRDKRDGIRGFANVCRHRGSKICTEPYGKVNAFVCPYHAWTYEFDGSLRSRRAMPVDFDPEQHGLKPVKVGIFHGLIFVNLNADASDLPVVLKPLEPGFKPYELENTKVACQRTYSVAANWKLTIENFMECYHCAPAHTEYSKIHALKSPRDTEALRPGMLVQAEKLGYCVDHIDNSRSCTRDEVQYYYVRHALYEPNLTGSRDGKAVAPLLGGIGDYGGGVADVQIGPVSHGVLYADHAVLYRFLPMGVQKTDMDVIWLVNAGAEEGRDYSVDELTWLWHVTTEADKTIILNNQKGVNSRFYQPGPLSDMEKFTTGFIQWYLAKLDAMGGT